MKFLVDTCGWIEWLADGKLAESFGFYLKNPKDLIVPTIIQYELYKWVCREKDSNLALEIIGLTENGIVISLDSHLALYAAEISKEYNLAMADAIIYAASRLNNVLLITSNKHFQKLPNIKFFEK